jgi:hypothetical protein
MKLLLPISALLIFITSMATHYELPESSRNRLSPHSLNRFAFTKYSQIGEEGIIAEIFKRLHIEKGFFVEFGAYDGLFLSNTRLLWENGWSGVMIEADKERFKQLLQNYNHTDNILFLNEFVTWHLEDSRGLTFDILKSIYFPSQEIDFLSIDIDGADYYILKSLNTKPKVICLENNLYWHPLFSAEVPEHIALQNLQQPLARVIELAREKGYEPVCLTINLFLVRKDLYQPFADTPSDAFTLWQDAFRACSTSDKIHMIQQRKTNPLIRYFEGEEFEKICPISVDF